MCKPQMKQIFSISKACNGQNERKKARVCPYAYTLCIWDEQGIYAWRWMHRTDERQGNYQNNEKYLRKDPSFSYKYAEATLFTWRACDHKLRNMTATFQNQT